MSRLRKFVLAAGVAGAATVAVGFDEAVADSLRGVSSPVQLSAVPSLGSAGEELGGWATVLSSAGLLGFIALRRGRRL